MLREEDIKDGKYLSIPQIAYEMKLSESTLRRYIRNYNEFFYAYIHNGCEYYKADETVGKLKIIRENSNVGKKNKERVSQVLNEQFEPYEKNVFSDYEKRLRISMNNVCNGLEEICIILKELAKKRNNEKSLKLLKNQKMKTDDVLKSETVHVRCSGNWKEPPGSFDPLHLAYPYPAKNDWDIPDIPPQDKDMKIPEGLHPHRFKQPKPQYPALLEFFIDDYHFQSAWNRPHLI